MEDTKKEVVVSSKKVEVNPEVNDGKEKDQFVSKEEFNSSMSMLMRSIETLTTAISQKKSDEVKQKVILEGGPDVETPIPPQWKLAVEEILGPEVGMRVEYPDNGGFKFTLIIPREISNAGDEYWKMYGHDERTKMLSPAEGLSGIRKYCELVKQNLSVKK